MAQGIRLTYIHHLLQSMEAGSKEKIVIRVAKNSKEISFNPATKSTLPETLEEVIHVDAVENSTKNCALPDTILHGKDLREHAIPSYICYLVNVDEYQNPDKYQR